MSILGAMEGNARGDASASELQLLFYALMNLPLKKQDIRDCVLQSTRGAFPSSASSNA